MSAPERPQMQTAAQAQQAEAEIAETAKEAAFEPIPEAPSPQERGADDGQQARPDAAVRPRRPERPNEAAPAPWLPPSLSTLLPRLVLPAALLAVPIVAALALQAWLARTHLVYDADLSFDGTRADKMVTALQWSPVDGVLYVGTLSGGVMSIGSGGPHFLNETFAEAIHHPVESFPLWGEQPYFLVQARYDLGVAGPPASGLFKTAPWSGLPDAQGGLFAAVEANNGSAVVGRAVSGETTQIDVAMEAQRAAQQPFQNQAPQPLSKGEIPLPPESLTVQSDAQAAPGGSPRYALVLYRDLHSAAVTEVGEIYGIEDVRAVAALPGTGTVIAGDGAGNVFAIDASQQISGASPETYIRGIGQHETAIVEIAVAAQPDADGVLFATRAEDRTVKVWRGSVSRASQFITLGDYPSTDVTTPGSTWVREGIGIESASDGVFMELLSMTSDGRRALATWGAAGVGLRVIDLPAQGETGAARQHGADSRYSYGPPAILSPDGTRMLAVNTTNATVDLVDLSNAGSTADPFPIATSFGRLAGIPMGRLAFDRNGDRFVALSGNGTIFIQDIATPDQAITLDQYQGAGVAAAISPDGSLVAVAESNRRITIHSGEDGSELAFFDGPQNLDRLVFDDSGRRLRASTIDAARIYTYSLRNLRSTIFGPNPLAEAGRDGFIPNGNRVFSRNGDMGFRIIDIDSGSTVGTLQAATRSTSWISNLDGSRIATLGGRGNISLFREEESAIARGPMPVMADHALRLSADGRMLAVGGRGGELYLARLDEGAGEAGYRLRSVALPAPALQYEISPDGGMVVTAEADGTVSINDLAYAASAPAVAADRAPGEGTGAAPFPGVTIAGTVEISGHGAPLTAIALSPDGDRLATASLDGRLRITSVAWAKFVNRLPLATLPSGPARAKLEPQPLDESPYALMGGRTTSSDFDDSEASGETFIVVYNARKSLDQALAARDRAAEAGFPGGFIYRRQGFFRGVFRFTTAEARDEALPRIQGSFSGAYARDLQSWCPNPSPTPEEVYIDCGAVTAGTAPPAMAN